MFKWVYPGTFQNYLTTEPTPAPFSSYGTPFGSCQSSVKSWTSPESLNFCHFRKDMICPPNCVWAGSALRVLRARVCAQACPALGGELCHPVCCGSYKLSQLEPEQASLSRSSDRAQTGVGRMKPSHDSGSRGIISKTAGLGSPLLPLLS